MGVRAPRKSGDHDASTFALPSARALTGQFGEAASHWQRRGGLLARALHLARPQPLAHRERTDELAFFSTSPSTRATTSTLLAGDSRDTSRETSHSTTHGRPRPFRWTCDGTRHGPAATAFRRRATFATHDERRPRVRPAAGRTSRGRSSGCDCDDGVT